MAVSLWELERRKSQRVTRGVIIALLVIATVVGGFFVISAGVKSLGRAVAAGFGNALAYGAADEAVTAVNTAHLDGVDMGQITAAQVERRDRGVRWVPGVDASTGFNVVSFTSSPGHIITALSDGSGDGDCNYGLYVASKPGQSTIADNLPSGQVFTTTLTDGSRCSADDAPWNGWTLVPNGDLS